MSPLKWVQNCGSGVQKAIGRSVLTVAFDAIGGPGVADLADCLCEGGTLINYGMLSNEPCVIAAEQLIFRGISLQGFWLSKVLNRLTFDERTHIFGQVVDMLQTDRLKLSIDSVFPMSKIDAALQRAERPGRRGKVIVTCQKGE